MKSLSIRYTVTSADVDIRKNYRASAFMSMAQEMANRHASCIGFGYDDLIRDNVAWVVSRMKVKYIKAPVWQDGIVFTTWHKGPDGVFSIRDFEVSDAESGETVIQATSSWLLIDTDSRRMLRPDHILGEKSTSTALDKDAVAYAEHRRQNRAAKAAAPKVEEPKAEPAAAEAAPEAPAADNAEVTVEA